MRNAIVTKKHRYDVGMRGNYVYWLVQGIANLAGRAEAVARYTVEFDLTQEEQEILAESLARLDARRAQPKPPKRPVDPYWSLWGRLKSQYRRLKAIEMSDDMEAGGGWPYKAAVAEYDEVEAEENHLPVTGLTVFYDGAAIVVSASNLSRKGNIVKTVRNDRHAVNYLRKLDTDPNYFQGQIVV